MTDTPKTMTTAEYAEISGMAVSTITQMLRQGKLCGEKRGGRWAILINADPPQPATEKKGQPAAIPPAAPKTEAVRYDVATFSKMTYLTENGVRQWLKSGRLTGGAGEDGLPEVDALNLERPDMRHLIRK
ncbi:hypothetical protein DESC_190088 [Desulfosarcina cetonica]|uniref:helix-turn-helix domain-containing protein n=1 Tax=Desulfosarcina cetonica TaxID=90730 RepID=UPI0006D095C1|nr:helix-turn-helix domain-containing protein [Desulfosarcina cetonica]VTR64471.1 hypothetical protein DESC_190088 [Desulfosarcina cetonica]